jgi:carbonic anhydrase
VFDQPLGQLFVIRVAGQVLDEAARSSIMYGVAALKTPLLLVLGHEQCGAVIAAVDALQGKAQPDYAFRFVEGIGPAATSVLTQPGDVVDNAVRANIKLGVAQLKSSQPVLAKAVSSGQVTIVGGYYRLATGAVTIIA